MTIRAYRGSDFGALKELICALQDFERGFDAARIVPDAAFAEWYAGKLFDVIQEQKGFILVAEEDGKVVGYAAGYADEEWEYRDTYFNIGELCVLPACRGRGIGTALMKAMEDYARKEGYARVGIGVLAPNQRVHGLYKRLGYADHAVRLRKKL
jgi:ribosomal protein S18 acetylase RimI-like enzyme